MREIRFRAWDDRRGKGIMRDADYCYDYFDLADLDQVGLHFQQYTGLYDKNGKEIYEGDIVKFKDFKDEIVAEVILKPAYVEYLPKDWRLGYIAWYVGGNIEVIGNIYENKELLEGG